MIYSLFSVESLLRFWGESLPFQDLSVEFYSSFPLLLHYNGFGAHKKNVKERDGEIGKRGTMSHFSRPEESRRSRDAMLVSGWRVPIT